MEQQAKKGAGKLAIIALTCTTIASLTANGLLYFRYSSSRPLVRIGNEAITKKEYQDTLDYLHGEQVLTKLVFDKIILQSAKNANVFPNDQEIEKRIAGIERLRPELLSAAKDNETSMRQVRESLRIQIALENLRLRGTSATESEIASFYAQNKPALALPSQMDSTVVVARNVIQAESVAQMLRKNVGLDTLARQPNIQVAGVNWKPNWASLPASARQQLTAGIAKLPAGSVGVLPIATGGEKPLYFIVRANQRRPGGTPPLAQIKDQVARSLRLGKAPSAQDTIARLYKESNVRFDIPKYASYFENVRRHAGTLSDSKSVASTR